MRMNSIKQNVRARWLVTSAMLIQKWGPWVLGRSATPGVIEGARYSFSPSRLGPLETEQKAGVRTGKPDFFVEEPMLSTGLHFASESTPDRL